MLDGRAHFDDAALTFDLQHPPNDAIATGRYHLISKSSPKTAQGTDDGDGEERSQFLYRLSHPLGEHVVESAKSLATTPAQIVFDVSHHPARIHTVEALRGKSGFLTLTRLVVESYEREEYLLFSGFDAAGASLDQETMEKLFGCAGRMDGDASIPPAEQERLNAESGRHAEATLSRSLELNNVHFGVAREKLDKWADDMVLSAEKALLETKEQIKARRRQARQAVTLDEQHDIQQQLQKLEKQQRRQRQDIFKAEDEIMEKRDSLIDSLERRLAQHTATDTLFTIRWAVQ
jgi:hypothetical protein